MKQALKVFFREFLKNNKRQFIWHSFWRLFGCAQTLFWPFAFAKVIDIVAQNPEAWQKAIPWVFAMVVNKIIEDVVRLKSKLGLQNLAMRIKIDIVKFLTKKTKVRDGIKTGEAVQSMGNMASTIESIVFLYKDKLLQLPVYFIAIPIILLGSQPSYFVLLILYIAIYLFIDYFAATFYVKEARDSRKASEAFWGTVYTKTPGVWRQREDRIAFEEMIDAQSEDFCKEENEAQNIHHWRWMMIQSLSSFFYGIAIAFVLYQVINGRARAGDLVLVIGYFIKTHASLNIVSDVVYQVINTRISFQELENAVEIG